jgi:hypothetical protein
MSTRQRRRATPAVVLHGRRHVAERLSARHAHASVCRSAAMHAEAPYRRTQALNIDSRQVCQYKEKIDRSSAQSSRPPQLRAAYQQRASAAARAGARCAEVICRSPTSRLLKDGECRHRCGGAPPPAARRYAGTAQMSPTRVDRCLFRHLRLRRGRADRWRRHARASFAARRHGMQPPRAPAQIATVPAAARRRLLKKVWDSMPKAGMRRGGKPFLLQPHCVSYLSEYASATAERHGCVGTHAALVDKRRGERYEVRLRWPKARSLNQPENIPYAASHVHLLASSSQTTLNARRPAKC